MICELCKQTKTECNCPPLTLGQFFKNYFKGLISVYKIDPNYRTRQISLTILGVILAIIFALGCGVLCASIVAGIVGTGGVLPLVFISVPAFAVMARNLAFFRMLMPEILIKIFGEGRFLAGLTKTKDGHPLRTSQKIALGISFPIVLSLGATMAALAFFNVSGLGIAFAFLAGASAAFPPLGLIFAGAFLLCLTFAMLNAFSTFIQEENLLAKLKNRYEKFIDIDPNSEHNKGKKKPLIIIERVLLGTLLGIFLLLAVYGIAKAMLACSVGLSSILMQIPHANPEAVQISSHVITSGLAFVAQLPFTFKQNYGVLNGTISYIFNLFKKTPSPTAVLAMPSKPPSLSIKLQTIAIKTLVITGKILWESLLIIKAIGDGALSAAGSAHGVSTGVACAGGALNSLTGSIRVEENAGENKAKKNDGYSIIQDDEREEERVENTPSQVQAIPVLTPLGNSELRERASYTSSSPIKKSSRCGFFCLFAIPNLYSKIPEAVQSKSDASVKNKNDYMHRLFGNPPLNSNKPKTVLLLPPKVKLKKQ